MFTPTNIQKVMQKHETRLPKSAVTTKGEGVVPLPVCPARRTLLVVSMSLSTQSPVFLPSRCETTKLSVLVDWIAEPVDSWVIADGIVGHINQDHLKVLVSRILCCRKRITNASKWITVLK